MRRKPASRRAVLPDPLFGSEQLTRFINVIMRDGKKSVAERVVYEALERVVAQTKAQQHTKESKEKEAESNKGKARNSIRNSAELRKLALESFDKALDNLRPAVEVKSRRVGGSNYQVPVEVRPERRTALAMRWLAEFSNNRSEKTMVLRLANEILDAMQNRGNAIKKKEETHRMAKANQAFAHYRW